MECERNRHEDRRPFWLARFGTSIRWIVSLQKIEGIESVVLGQQQARKSIAKVFEPPHNTLITKNKVMS
jgi:hypothetical protein